MDLEVGQRVLIINNSCTGLIGTIVPSELLDGYVLVDLSGFFSPLCFWKTDLVPIKRIVCPEYLKQL